METLARQIRGVESRFSRDEKDPAGRDRNNDVRETSAARASRGRTDFSGCAATRGTARFDCGW